MPKYFHIIILISSFILVQCKGKTKTYQPTTTTINGQIISPEHPEVTLIGLDKMSTKVSGDGKFSIQADLNQSGIYAITNGRFGAFVFVVPGDKITVNAKNQNGEMMTTFVGDHAKENTYLQRYAKLKQDFSPDDPMKFYTQKEEDFLRAVEERFQNMVKDQQEFQKKEGAFDETFAELISEEISYDAAVMKMNYPTYFDYFSPDSALVLSDTYDSFFQNLEVDNDDFLLIPSYREFIDLYVDFKAKPMETTDSISHNINKFNQIGALFRSKKVKEELYHNTMVEMLNMSANDASKVIGSYQQLQTSPNYLTEINQEYRAWMPLLKGQPAPSFAYPSIQKKSVSLESMKGKLVYIDVWASWCGPCMRELPYLEKLQEKYAKSDKIAFVSISVDEDKVAWESTITQKKMKGIQLLADHAWQSKIIQDYRINGIPRFILIDQNGKILDANAPRPSAKELENVLEKYL